MTIVTRFAPSPTGYLHIGGARTALFNWLFARHHGGSFRLRIEDTDRARSTQPAIEAILDGMRWLGLEWDGPEIYQFSRTERHQEAVAEMLKRGMAYRCYTPMEELEAKRAAAQAEGKVFRFESPWRDRPASEAPDAPFVVRLKAPNEGHTEVHDKVQGEVRFPNTEMDDLVLLRSDGTPTYNLAVVVDDHDMGVTHVIRGDDHLTNAGRQTLIYRSLDWQVPVFAHVPLIHGPDGAKLSKRHGALGVDAYRDMGYLPEAMRNYLLRLGWSHGDDELITTEQAVEWFNLEGIGKSPARIDFVKMEHVNHHYLQSADHGRLLGLIRPALEEGIGGKLSEKAEGILLRGLGGLKARAKTIPQLAEAAMFYARSRPVPIEDDAQKPLAEPTAKPHLMALHRKLQAVEEWSEAALDAALKAYVAESGAKFKEVGMPLRAALSGTTHAPSVGEIMVALGKTESLARIGDVFG